MYAHVKVRTKEGEERQCYVPVEVHSQIAIIGMDLGRRLEGAFIHSVSLKETIDGSIFDASVYSFREWSALPKCN